MILDVLTQIKSPHGLFIQWLLGDLSLGLKWPEREAENPPSCSASVKNE
jgi:hypothetical protein